MSVNLLNQATVQLTTINCGECGGTYALNERYRAQKHTEGGYWNCPYCKCSWGYGEGANDKLKKQLAEAERLRDWHKARQADERAARERVGRQLSAQRGATKRIKNRVKHGVCPCCTRSFGNLRDHMKSQHPDYVAEVA